jgi:hypothetical protein
LQDRRFFFKKRIPLSRKGTAVHWNASVKIKGVQQKAYLLYFFDRYFMVGAGPDPGPAMHLPPMCQKTKMRVAELMSFCASFHVSFPHPPVSESKRFARSIPGNKESAR